MNVKKSGGRGTTQTENDSAASRSALDFVKHRNFSDIDEEKIDWFWLHRIATKANAIGGAPGVGKSQLAANCIATVTTGGRWPDNTPCQIGSAIIITSEDDAGDTIKPRLVAAGADVSKVSILDAIKAEDGKDQPWTLDDIVALEALVQSQHDTRLIVIDPITAYLGHKDGHNTADVRGMLAPVQELANKYNICILMITHLNKSQGANAGERFNGSTAWVAVSRSAWLVGEHPDDDTKRVFVPVKNNLGDDKQGYAYHIEPFTTASGTETSRIVWDGPIDLKADDVVNGPRKTLGDPENQSAKAEAARFLMTQLKDGRKASTQIWAEAKEAGIAEKTLKRAKKDIGVESLKDGSRHYMQFVEKPADNQRGPDDPPLTGDPLDPLDPLHTVIVQQEGQEGQEGQDFGVGPSGPLEPQANKNAAVR